MAGSALSLSSVEATTSAVVSGDRLNDGYETEDFELVDGEILPKLVLRHARPSSIDRNTSPSSSGGPVTIPSKKYPDTLQESVILPKGWRKLSTRQLKEFLRKKGVRDLHQELLGLQKVLKQKPE